MSWPYKCAAFIIINCDLLLAQNCLKPAGGQVPFEDPHGDSTRLPSGSQAIVTSYRFQCYGNITAWWAYIRPKSCCMKVTIHFQVWRPSESVDTDGCYSLVGEDRFVNIRQQTIQDGLVNRTLEPENFLTVQPGDVVGYYTPRTNNRDRTRIQLHTNYTNESIWYTTDIDGEEGLHSGALCRYPGGQGQVLRSFTRAAPILSMAVSKCSKNEWVSHSTSEHSGMGWETELTTSRRAYYGIPEVSMGFIQEHYVNTQVGRVKSCGPSLEMHLAIDEWVSHSTTPFTCSTTLTPIASSASTTSPSFTPPSVPTSTPSSILTPITSGSSSPLRTGIAAGVGGVTVLVVLAIVCAISVTITRRKLAKKYDTDISTNIPSTVYKKRPIKRHDTAMERNSTHITTPSITISENENSGATTPDDQLYATVQGEQQQQDMELTQNQAYVTTTNIPVEANECYGITAPSVGPDDQLYATVDGEHNISHTTQQSHMEDDDFNDYVIL